MSDADYVPDLDKLEHEAHALLRHGVLRMRIYVIDVLWLVGRVRQPGSLEAALDAWDSTDEGRNLIERDSEVAQRAFEAGWAAREANRSKMTHQ